jgi:hypothetical protein
MPSLADIKAGGAFVELYTKDSRFYKGLRAAAAGYTSWGQRLTAIGARVMAGGAAITGPFLVAAKVFAKMGDELDKMSARTGVSVESLSELSFAAEQSGASINDLEGLLAKMNRRLGRVTAGAGSGSQVGAIEELGLSVDELEKKDAEGRFLAIAGAMAEYGDSAAAAGLAQRIFGTSVDKVLPLIMSGRAGIAALRQEARDRGLVISTEDATRAAEFTDQLSRMTHVLKIGLFSAGSSVAEMLGDWIMRGVEAIQIGVRWVKENQALFLSIFKVGLVVTAAGAGLVGLGTILALAGAAAGGVAALMTTCAGAVAGLLAVVGFLLSPIGLLTAALAGLAGYAVYSSGVLGWLRDRFTELKEFALDAFGGIKDAMAAGDFQLAGQILWAAIKVQWTQGINWLMGKWEDFKGFFLSGWTDAVYGLASVFTEVVANLQSTWFTFAEAFQNRWKDAEKTLAHGIAWAVAKLEGLDPAQVAQTLEEDYGRQAADRAGDYQARQASIESDRTARQAALEDARQAEQAKLQAAAAGRAQEAQKALDRARAEYSKLRQRARELAEAGPRRAKEEMPQLPADAGQAPVPAVAAGQKYLAETAEMFTKEFYQAVFGRDRGREAEATRKKQLHALLRTAGHVESLDNNLAGIRVITFPKGG